MVLDGIIDWITNPTNFLSIFFYVSSLIIAFVISFYVARHYSPKAEPVFQQVAFRIIEETHVVLSKQVKISYGDENVPRLTKCYFIFWNRGASNLDGSTMQPQDPLKLSFAEGTNIYEVVPLAKLRSTIDLKWRIEGCNLFISFNDLESNEGFNLEILHTAEKGLPIVSGSFRNIPHGLKDLGDISSSQWPHAKRHWSMYFIIILTLFEGGLMIYIYTKTLQIFYLVLAVFVFAFFSYLVYRYYWTKRRLYPENLDIQQASIG
jgi:hypothetical protein